MKPVRYTEVDLVIAPLEPWRDLLMAEMIELGYEGFEETAHGLKAYIATAQFRAKDLDRTLVMRDPHVHVAFTAREVPNLNWNAKWEEAFQPMVVDGKVYIRAEFHPPMDGIAQEVIITPRMAFGTGHHATTRMMVRSMLGMKIPGKRICDLGCGTGVLAILAEKMGASQVVAIDNDPNAVENARRNAELNHCQRVAVEKGDAHLQQRASFDAILANIERNTLIRAMPEMAAALRPGGTVVLSGFVRGDGPLMAMAARQQGLVPIGQEEEGEWQLQRWEKNKDQ